MDRLGATPGLPAYPPTRFPRPAAVLAPDAPHDVRPFAEIARGPVASVFKAVDRTTGETVLLKQLRPGALADPERSARFAEEARLAATVQHPNVVRVRHVAADGASLVADWVEGADLQATLDAHGALPAGLAARVAADALRGLAAVHAAGILHRDLKAANVLLGADGTVRLTDFGLASLVPDDPAGDGGEVRGTLATLAPEIVRGAAPTAASDVFSLGAVLMQMLTGRAPFAAATASGTLDAVLHTDAAALLAADPRVPDALAAVAAPLLARDPSARPTASAAADALDAATRETADGLAAWLADPSAYRAAPLPEAPSAAPLPSTLSRPAVPRRRRPTVLAGLALAAVALVAMIVLRRDVPDARPAPVATAARDAPPPVRLAPSDTLAPAEPSPDSRLADAPALPTLDAAPTTRPATEPTTTRDDETPRRELSEPLRPDASPTTAAPTPAAVPRPGTLVVAAEPWAAVRVDGRAVGTTPAVAPLSLPAGDYEVPFENPAFPTHTVTVRVAPGATARAEVSLWSLVARVALDVTPWAEVFVDGERWGTVPPQARPLVLPPGAHVLTFVHPSLGRREVPLRVAAGEARTVRVRLAEPAR